MKKRVTYIVSFKDLGRAKAFKNRREAFRYAKAASYYENTICGVYTYVAFGHILLRSYEKGKLVCKEV